MEVSMSTICSMTNEQRGMCRNGHPWKGDNIMVTASGSKRCRTCYTAAVARYKADKEEFGVRLTIHEKAERARKGRLGPQFFPKLLKRRKSTTRFL